uniref:Uncharacterized protein n=1 Tax=virus sp. ctDYl1 TaxID=2826795 RepID=A0A8S5R9S6_9VIRU|nr:MAG TPA: hypothetical protein [virus sp. ctDYl1]
MGVESMIHTAYDVMKGFLITDADPGRGGRGSERV